MKVTLGSTCAHLANAGVAVALGTCMLIRLSYAHVQRLYQRRRLRASAAGALHLSSLYDRASGLAVTTRLRELKGQTSVALATDNSRCGLAKKGRRERENEERREKGSHATTGHCKTVEEQMEFPTMRPLPWQCRLFPPFPSSFFPPKGNWCINMERGEKINK